jgi:hypothetical protein
MFFNTEQNPSGAFDAPEDGKRPDSDGAARHDAGGSLNESEPFTRSKFGREEAQRSNGYSVRENLL